MFLKDTRPLFRTLFTETAGKHCAACRWRRAKQSSERTATFCFPPPPRQANQRRCSSPYSPCFPKTRPRPSGYIHRTIKGAYKRPVFTAYRALRRRGNSRLALAWGRCAIAQGKAFKAPLGNFTDNPRIA